MSQLGIALIGAGGRTTSFFGHAASTLADCRIVGITDLIAEKARFLLDHYNSDARLYEGTDEALADPDVDAVVICTHDAAHAEPSVKALRAGKHVYCEKPLATTLEDCHAIIEAAKDSPSVFYLGLNLRHSPVYETVRRLLDQGYVGRITSIEANEWYYEGRTYFNRWNRLRAAGGGLWVTKATHDFDLLNWFAGGRATRVYATGSLSHYRPKPEAGERCRDCPIRRDCPDFIDMFAENGAIGHRLGRITERHGGDPVDVCLYNSDKDTFDNGIAVVDYDNDIRAVYSLNVVASRTTRQLAINGDKGVIEADLERDEVLWTERHTHRTARYDLKTMTAGGHGGADGRIWRDFLLACRTGKAPTTSWAEGTRSVQLGIAATESMDTGLPVEIGQCPAAGVSGTT